MKKKNNRIDLITDSVSNNISESGEEHLAEWEKDNPDNKKLRKVLNCIHVSDDVYEIGKSMQSEILRDVNNKIDRYMRRKVIYRISAVAACISSIIIISSLFFNNSASDFKDKNELLTVLESTNTNLKDVHIVSGTNQKRVNNDETITLTKEGSIIVGEEDKIESADIKTEYVTIIVPKGKRSTIKFSDGSVAHINSGSKLIYPKIFGQKSRDIVLDGEIYIDVAKDEEKPFYVRTKEFDIAVLGTQFNVNAYSEDNSNSVVLVKGSVMVQTGDKNSNLSPNQGFFINDGQSRIKNVDVYSYICWKNGILKLQEESFNNLLKKLSRYYGIEIQTTRNFDNVVFDGSLNLQDSLEDVLRILSISKAFTYNKVGNKIQIE